MSSLTMCDELATSTRLAAKSLIGVPVGQGVAVGLRPPFAFSGRALTVSPSGTSARP